MHLGHQKRSREIADWARSKKRRMIRREDLLAYLAGKPLPPLTYNHVNRRWVFISARKYCFKCKVYFSNIN